MGRPCTFTAEEDRQLALLFDRGLSRPEIAFVMGRTIKAVAWRMESLGLSMAVRNRDLKDELAAARAVVRKAWERRRARSAVRKAMRAAGLAVSARGRDKACRLANNDAGSFEAVKDATAARRGPAASLTATKAPEQSTVALRAAQPAPKPFPTSFRPSFAHGSGL